MLKIGFDISQTGQDKAGCGYFSYSLLHALLGIDIDAEFIVYPSFGDGYWDADCSLENCVEPLARKEKRIYEGIRHSEQDDVESFWRAQTPDMSKKLGNPDIVHANNYFSPVSLQHTRLLYTLYDLSFFENPEWHTEENRLVTSSGVFRASVYADGILAISEYSRQHFLRYFPYYPPERIWVAPLASRFPLKKKSMSALSNVHGLRPQRFWLSVGTLEPRKNHLRLLKAYAKLVKRKGTEVYPLVLVGAKGWRMGHLQRLIREMGLEKHVRILGYVEDELLQSLYLHCYAFVYPSLFEGFGLPPLEAMSMGAAVITSDSTSIPEVVGQAGYLINPEHEESIYKAMSLFQDKPILRGEYKQRALEQAAKFSWKKTAQTIFSIYEEIYSLPKLYPPSF